MAEQRLRITLIGDSQVGKSCLINGYKQIKFPDAEDSDFYDFPLVCYDKSILLWLSAPGGSDDNDHARTVHYMGLSMAQYTKYQFVKVANDLDAGNCGALIICFSVVNPKSFTNLTYKWFPEGKHYCHGAPIVLVGTKADLRNDPETINRLAERNTAPISYTEGYELALKMGCYAYIETSSVTGNNVQEVFDLALESCLAPGAGGIACPLKPLKPTEPKVEASELHIHEALQKLIGKQEISDVTLALKDDEVPAHKIILACSMPIFYNALVKHKGDLPRGFKFRETGAKNNTTDQMIIDVDIDPAVLNCILYSIYTGYPAHQKDFNKEIVQKAFDFFVEYPRYNLDERRRLLSELALNPNPPFADVRFDMDSGKHRVLGHKALLGPTSEYFSALFNSGMKEAQLDVIQLQGVDESEFLVLKEFSYCGRSSSLNAKNVANVIPLANRFIMNELLTYCEVLCKDNIDSFDLYEIYQLALAHNCTQLEAYVIWQMKIQYDDIKSKGWFKNKLPQDIRAQVEAGQWPGQEYHESVKAWQQRQKIKGKAYKEKNKDKEGKKNKDDKDCGIM